MDTEKLIELRRQRLGYMKIANLMGISINTVKSYCKRHKITRDTKAEVALKEHACLQCGMPVKQLRGKREKEFCCDACRMKWWSAHQALLHHRKTHSQVCPHCHKTFTVINSRKRKYCCHACYIADRFGDSA